MERKPRERKAISPRRSFLIDLHDTMLPNFTYDSISLSLSLSLSHQTLPCFPCLFPVAIRHAEPRTQHHSACIFLSPVSPTDLRLQISDEGPPWRRRLPLLHRLHVAVRRRRRRPARQEATSTGAAAAGRQPLLPHHHHGGHHTGQSPPRGRDRRRGEGERGDRHGGGAAAAKGDQDLLCGGVRRRGRR